ncbi:MAG: hypothetical protein J1E98_10705 [Lachnospiraceae bacterium]|nr:hypothetical protein [Lachnospiraceae bacterium]
MSNSVKEGYNCYYIKLEYHQIGVGWKKTAFGNKVRCYDDERTICDLLRTRSRMDEETVISSIIIMRHIRRRAESIGSLCRNI